MISWFFFLLLSPYKHLPLVSSARRQTVIINARIDNCWCRYTPTFRIPHLFHLHTNHIRFLSAFVFYLFSISVLIFCASSFFCCLLPGTQLFWQFLLCSSAVCLSLCWFCLQQHLLNAHVHTHTHTPSIQVSVSVCVLALSYAWMAICSFYRCIVFAVA